MTITTAVAYVVLIGGISFVICALALLINGFDSFDPNTTNDPENNTSNPSSSQQYSDQVAAAVATYDQNRNAQERQRSRRESINLQVLTATGMFALAAAAAGIYSAWIFQGQLNEMRNEQRPWVGVEAAIDGIRWDSGGVHIPTKFNIKNSGKSPALSVVFSAELFPIPSNPQGIMPYTRIKQMAEAERARTPDTSTGFPIMPGEAVPSVREMTYSREQIKSLADYFATFKNKPSDPPSGIDRIDNIGLMILYAVDYFNDSLAMHKQFYCGSEINWIDPSELWRPGLGLPVDRDIPSSQLRLSISNFNCQAN